MDEPPRPGHSSPIDLTTATPPAWTQDGAVTPPAQPDAPPPMCVICQSEVHPDANNQHTPHEWPRCRHRFHIGCPMHFITRQRRPTCPTCRQPWTQGAQHALDQARQAANLEWPIPETPIDTRLRTHRPPEPPTHIVPLCCPRLALIDPEHPENETSWRELPTRHMEWAPVLDQAS